MFHDVDIKKLNIVDVDNSQRDEPGNAEGS